MATIFTNGFPGRRVGGAGTADGGRRDVTGTAIDDVGQGTSSRNYYQSSYDMNHENAICGLL
jgi:hypothetical protein